jgi:hypothetical protein
MGRVVKVSEKTVLTASVIRTPVQRNEQCDTTR